MHEIPVGKGEKLTDGNDVAVLSIGPMASKAAAAIKRAAAEGISAAHYDMIFLKPIDTAILKEVAEKGCEIITVEDGIKEGGLGSAVVEWLNDNGYDRKVTRIGVPDKFVPHGKVPELMRLCEMDEEAIYKAIVNANKPSLT